MPQLPGNSYSIRGRRAFSNENLNFDFGTPDSSLAIPGLAGTQTSSVAQADAYPVGSDEAVLAAIKITGTPTGTLVMNIQTSTTFGGSFTTIASTPSISAAGTYYLMAPVTASIAPATQWYKVTLTLATTPSFIVAGVAVKTFNIVRK